MAAYTTIDDPSAYFQTITWTGNGSDPRTITFDGNSDMQPDWVWEKSRSLAYQHNLYDSVRGGGKGLDLPAAAVEVSNNANGYISAFTSDGFTLTAGSTNNELLNENTTTYVGWGWKAGTSFTNDASSTGIGSIDSSGSVNQDAGFSIVSYTGNSPTATTIKHGLNSVPQMIIFKRRVGAGNFTVYHQSLGNTKGMFLTTTAAADTSAGYFNNTTPTSSVFSVANSGDTNSNGNPTIAYCFAEKQGYSKFSSFVGSGNADGPFIYTGFKPAWIMTKIISSADDWQICDNKRDPDNAVFSQLNANSSAAQNDGDAKVDFLSNGFKIRKSGGSWNASGSSFIYMAFAEQPLVTSSGVPATAR